MVAILQSKKLPNEPRLNNHPPKIKTKKVTLPPIL